MQLQEVVAIEARPWFFIDQVDDFVNVFVPIFEIRRNLVPFVRDTLKKPELALTIASRLRLPGSEKLHQARFQQLVAAGDIRGAATMAAKSPGGALRTPETIKIFQGMPAVAGQPVPVLQYFSILLEQGRSLTHC